MFAVVVLDGDGASSVRGLVMTRDVSGERSVALVPLGSARRATARGLGLGVVAEEGVATGSATRPTALGVGVAGGGMVDFEVRLLGVDGASATSSTAAAGEAFLLRDFGAGAGDGDGDGGGAIGLMAGAASAWALRRADRRLDIVKGTMNASDGVE